MYAHATLWVDDNGQLCEEPPARGLKIAATKGDELPREFVAKYGLSEKGGKVVQLPEKHLGKKQAKAENKAVEAPPNKGGGLSITHGESTRSSVQEKDEPKDPEPGPEKPKAKKPKRSR